MALKLKYTDEHGIVHINMSPNSSPSAFKDTPDSKNLDMRDTKDSKESKFDLKDPKFDTINNRFGSYDLFGAKYEAGYKTDSSGDVPHSLFRSRYNSIEEELANTPYAFATERSLRAADHLDITIDRSIDISPSKDIEDDRFFHRSLSLDYEDAFRESTPAFTVTQLIHAQDRYFDLSKKESKSIFEKDKSFVVKSTPDFERDCDKSTFSASVETTFEKCSGTDSSSVTERTAIKAALPARVALPRTSSAVPASEDSAFQVLKLNSDVDTQTDPIATTVVPISVRKKEKSFAILTETPIPSRPSSPRSLPVDIRQGRVSPFKGRGFREETSRHNTPRTSAANSRTCSPSPRRRTNSLSKIDKMASTATLPPPILLTQPPRNFLKENIDGIREISEQNREKHQAEAEKKKIEEEAAILKEMGLSDKAAKKEATRSVVASRNNSRANSRSNSPSKLNLRSRSSSPATKLNKDKSKSKEFINVNDGMPKPAIHKSRVRSVSKSQPASKGGSPKNSKIPKRQSSVSPKGTISRHTNFLSRRTPSNHLLSQDSRFMSSSTSSIHETIRVGSTIHDKRFSQSAQHLSLSPKHIKGKPPISPGRGGPPPANKTINSKRLSPIVGTPNKSPIDDKIGKKPGSKLLLAKKPIKSTTSTATSKVNSKQTSRDPSPDKKKMATKPASTRPTPKPVTRTPSTKSIQKPATPSKIEPKKPINRTDSMKSLTRTSSTKNLASKPPLKRSDSKLSNKSQSSGKINEVGRKDSTKKSVKTEKSMSDSATDPEEIPKQDSETQYDNLKITNDKGELVIMTKKSIVSMTTAAITSQPLEIVTTVTNQLPNTLEKAREKRNIERLSSKDSLVGKDEPKIEEKKKGDKSYGKSRKDAKEDKDSEKPEETHKLRPLQPPFNDPQLEKVKQKIDDILKTPEISSENILSTSAKSREVKPDPKFKNLAEKTKTDVKQAKDSISEKLMEMKNQMAEQKKESNNVAEAATAEIRTEAAKIVDSIITPVEEPKAIPEKAEEPKKNIEPIVMVVSEKKKEVTDKKQNIPETKKEETEKKKEAAENKHEEKTESKKEPTEKKKELIKKKELLETVEKVNETLVKGEAEVEVLSSNVSTPGVEKMSVESKMMDGNRSDRSHSNGGFPQSTSTTPKPPARTRKEQKEKEKEKEQSPASEASPKDDAHGGDHKKPNICSRLMGKCKSKCCPCCIKGEKENETEDHTQRRERESTIESMGEKKHGMMGKFSCCKKKTPVVEEVERDMERAAGKGATIEFEDETKRKRKLRDIICCCGRKRRVTDAAVPAQNVADVTMSPMNDAGVVGDTGCCGKKRQIERRDSILSDRPPANCCNRMCTWFRGMCRRPAPVPTSRRASMFSKNKSLSPTLPPEDTRKKLDPSLIEHTSMIRAAIPILPRVLAYFCLVCNVIVPGLGSIFSGLFCLCFGIPRFGPHDGAKYRIGSFIINLLVGAGQLFTVLFCLVGWGWSIWWGVIMIKISRKYRRLKREAEMAEAEAAAVPVTANNHTRA